jgi:putative Mg2+ transporter-C (MgtC) family protein
MLSPFMHDLFLKLAGDWQLFIPQPAANGVLALVAALCGALVGMEREKKDKPTGIRTLTLVCLGSAVFTMVSGLNGDTSGRVIAQIVSGVGFLGAGAIIHRRFSVAGMTTAATIWITAAIGTVIGLGYAGAGIGISLFVLGVLTLTTFLERAFLGNCHFSELHLVCAVDGGKTILKIEQVLEEFPVELRGTGTADTVDGDKLTITLRYCSTHKIHRGVLVRLAEIPEILEMHRGVLPATKQV